MLRPGGVFVAADSLASAELAAFHHGGIYKPVDPATLDIRLTDAGFAAVEVRSNEFGWAARAVS